MKNDENTFYLTTLCGFSSWGSYSSGPLLVLGRPSNRALRFLLPTPMCISQKARWLLPRCRWRKIGNKHSGWALVRQSHQRRCNTGCIVLCSKGWCRGQSWIIQKRLMINFDQVFCERDSRGRHPSTQLIQSFQPCSRVTWSWYEMLHVESNHMTKTLQRIHNWNGVRNYVALSGHPGWGLKRGDWSVRGGEREGTDWGGRGIETTSKCNSDKKPNSGKGVRWRNWNAAKMV